MVNEYENLRNDYNSLLTQFDQSQELRKIYQKLIKDQNTELEDMKGQLAMKQQNDGRLLKNGIPKTDNTVISDG